MFTPQPVAPPLQLMRPFIRRKPLPLPDCVVDVLHRKGCTGWVPPVDPRRVACREFLQHELHRPAVTDDVMDGNDQQPVGIRDLYQSHAQQAAGAQVEGRLLDAREFRSQASLITPLLVPRIDHADICG